MTLFKLWLTFIEMENYERKIIIPTKSTACNSIHTSMIFMPKSHNYNLLWGWKGYDTAYPCKESSYYKILSIFYLNKVKKYAYLFNWDWFPERKVPRKICSIFFITKCKKAIWWTGLNAVKCNLMQLITKSISIL